MRFVLASALIAALSGPLAATECDYPQKTAVESNGHTRTIFINACNQRYEVGYRLDGNTLIFPTDGRHEIKDASPPKRPRKSCAKPTGSSASATR